MSFPIENKWMNDTTNIKKREKAIYTVVDFPEERKNFGRFKGSSPKRAAMKAFTRLAKISKLNNTDRQFIVFTILNLTNDKEYKYIGTRVKLVKPRTVNRGGKKIVYKYINTVGKYKEVLNKIK